MKNRFIAVRSIDEWHAVLDEFFPGRSRTQQQTGDRRPLTGSRMFQLGPSIANEWSATGILHQLLSELIHCLEGCGDVVVEIGAERSALGQDRLGLQSPRLPPSVVVREHVVHDVDLFHFAIGEDPIRDLLDLVTRDPEPWIVGPSVAGRPLGGILRVEQSP